MGPLVGSAKAQPTFAMLCVYDNYEATRIQRIPFLVGGCVHMQASVQQPPQIEDARRALPDRSLGYSFSSTFDSNGGLQCQQFLTSALGVCAQHVRACSFSVCVSNRRPAIHDVGCWFCLYVRYSLLWCTLSLCAAHGGGKCGFVGCAWAQPAGIRRS